MSLLTSDQIKVLNSGTIDAEKAPEGFLWVCLQCGSVAKNRRGPALDNAIVPWEEDCYRSAVLAHVNDISWSDTTIGRGVAGILLIAYNPTDPPKDNPSQMTNEEYVKKEGSFCPWCNSDDVEATSSPCHDCNIFWQDVRCNSCEKEWTDEYNLVRYEKIDDEER